MLPLLIGLGGLGLLRAMPTFGAEDVASGPFHHEDLTFTAATLTGWADGDGPDDPTSAAASLAWHCDYVDSYLYNPIWWATGGMKRFRAALLARSHLVKLHFDDLGSTSQVDQMWQRYLGGSVAGVLWAAERDDVVAARHVAGVTLHALQDFYAHSNWVDDPVRRTLLWLREDAEVDALDLYTGTYELPHTHGRKPHGKIRFDCVLLREVVGARWMSVFCDSMLPTSTSSLCRRWQECRDATDAQPDTLGGIRIPIDLLAVDEGIALDSRWQAPVALANRELPDRAALTAEHLFETAYRLALSQSVLWLRVLHVIMDQQGFRDFWTRVRTEDRGPRRALPRLGTAFESFMGAYPADLIQYEDPTRMLFTFLSAGDYPPPPRTSQAEEGWWLRIEVATADATYAGTDAEIFAEVDGRRFRLDHMHDRRPGGGPDQWRLLEYDDFEAGRRSTYVIGPFDELPTRLTFHNEAADVLDVLSAAWQDFVDFLDSIWDGFVKLALSLVGGHADFVDTAVRTWSWAELREIAAGGAPRAFTLAFDGAAEGRYHLQARVAAHEQDGGLRVDVTYDRLDCHEESKVDQPPTTYDDEPFVLLAVEALGSPDGRVSGIAGPYSSVDSGDQRHVGKAFSVRVPRHSGLVTSAQVWESDSELGKGRRNLLDQFNSRFGDATTDERSRFLDALGAAFGSDWRIGSLDVYAFRRGATVETAHLLRERVLDRWVGGDSSLTVELDAVTPRAVWSRPLAEAEKLAFRLADPVLRPPGLDRLDVGALRSGAAEPVGPVQPVQPVQPVDVRRPPLRLPPIAPPPPPAG